MQHRGHREMAPTKRRKIGWQIPTIIVCVIVIVATILLKYDKEPQSTNTLSEEVVQLLGGQESAPKPSQVASVPAPVPAPTAKSSTAPAKPKGAEKNVAATATLSDSKLLYGIERANYQIKQGTIQKGQTLATIIKEYVGWGTINKIVEEAKPLFNLNNVKAGNKWTVFYNTYADKGAVLDYFVYEINKTEVLVVELTGGEISCSRREK